MKFISTRNPENSVNFEKAVINCLPEDGGLFVPGEDRDLRKWILYTNQETSFQSIAGSLTSACVNDEFSPIICETIATKAFPFSPSLKKLKDNFYSLELFNTPTGSHKDFGISFLINCLETILTMKGQTGIFVDATVGELGASVARAMSGLKHLKAVLIYPKGKVRGLNESDFVWNGGNIYPVEIEGTEKDCHNLVRQIFDDKDLVEKLNLTVANTANIGRLMAQMFFYPFAFSRLKGQVNSAIYYAVPCGNYSNLVAGLYSWKLNLPVNGFICPTTDEIKSGFDGKIEIMDSLVDFVSREKADPASPSNLERLEDVFHNNSMMLKNLIFPGRVTEEQKGEACRELYMKYNIFADELTSAAYAAAKVRKELTEDEDETIVLVQRDHPALSSEWIRHNTGIAPEMPSNIAAALTKNELNRPFLMTAEDIKQVILSLS